MRLNKQYIIKKGYIKRGLGGICGNMLGILFPERCAVCGNILKKGEAYICDGCKGRVAYISDPFCRICGRKMKVKTETYCNTCKTSARSFDRGVSVFVYDDLIRGSIHSFKYDNKRTNGIFYSSEVIRIYGGLIKSWNPDVFIPVPIHKSRYIKRGYNQSEIIATHISDYIGVPSRTDILYRIKKTAPQNNLNRVERGRNMQAAFAVNPSKLDKIKTVILIDDIFTTGSTLNGCASILKAAGVEKVYFICIAAGICDYEKI